MRPSSSQAPRGAASSDPRAGFTPIELVIVVVILGILTAGIVPVYAGSMSALSRRTVQGDVAALIQFVQQRAVSDSREYRFYLDPDEGAYWVMFHDGYKKDEKTFREVEEPYGVLTYLPERLEAERPRAPKDRERDAYYLSCRPSGACDVVEFRFHDKIDKRRRIIIETTGVMGDVLVERK